MLSTIIQLHGKNDRYFFGKSPLNLHGRDVNQSCNKLFYQLCLKCRETDIYSVCYILTKKTQSTEQVNLPLAQTGWWFFVLQICHKHSQFNILYFKHDCEYHNSYKSTVQMSKICQIWHVTDMSNLTYLFTDLSYFFCKNGSFLQCSRPIVDLLKTWWPSFRYHFIPEKYSFIHTVFGCRYLLPKSTPVSHV